jgi:hypothetical protein
MSSNPQARESRSALGLAFLAVLVSSIPAGAASVGLSSVGAQRFSNEDLLVFIPESGDRFAWSLATGDFNGDGADDLASGVPYDDGFGVPDSGLVIVRYGIPGSSLETGLADNALSQFFGGSPDPDEEGDLFGWALVACDFNGDGFDDLAVGILGEDVSGVADAGAVQIHYGAAAGLDGAGDEFYTQASEGMVGDIEENDSFGSALACGDFNADGFADLVIGVPHEDIGGFPGAIGAGMINMVPGSAVGLDSAASTALDQDSPGMDGGSEVLDWFGAELASGDFNGDEFADLAIGVTQENFGSGEHGAVHIVYGGTSGLTAAGNFLFSETLFGGTPAGGDAFGGALATGDFDGDGYDDLAIGVPYKNHPPVGGVEQPDTGAIGEVFGSAAGLSATNSHFWYEEDLSGLHASEPHDLFGYALAAGDFDRDGVDDLAVGQPWESVGQALRHGSTTVISGSPGVGLFLARNRTLEAGFEGVPGEADEWLCEFGTSLAVGDFNGNGHSDLAIGSPWENDFGLTDIGSLTVLLGGLFADGFETASTSYWSPVMP